METAFTDFLNADGLSLNAISLPTLFDALIGFFESTRIEHCSVTEEEDYLHCEVFENVITFERLLYVPMELMYKEDVGDNTGYREKWGLYLFTLPNHQALPGTPNVPDINLWSSDYSSVAAFSQEVRELPLMQWAMTQGELAAGMFFESVG